ncbi:MAG: hypothetical protein WAW96_16160 [Alphaproteobacteria bacterium]
MLFDIDSNHNQLPEDRLMTAEGTVIVEAESYHLDRFFCLCDDPVGTDVMLLRLILKPSWVL